MKFSTQNWLSASIILVSVAVVSKGLGFLREMLIAYYFGTSAQVDAFMIAFSLPMWIAGSIGVAFSTALVPAYQKALSAGGTERGNHVVSSVLMSATVLSALFLLPLSMMPLSFIQTVAPLLPEATAHLAARLTQWLALYIFGLNLVYLLTAIYHSFHHFRIPAFADLAFNVMTIVTLLGFALTFGIHALVFGNIIGIALCIMILVSFLAKGDRAKLVVSVTGSDIRSLLLLALPILLFEFSSQLGALVENYYASGLSEGSIAALTYAKRITTTIVALLALNIARGIFPTLASLSAEQKREEAKALFVKLNKQLVILVVPIAVCLLWYRNEILSVIYLRGAFNAAGLDMTSAAFVFYASGLLVAVIEPVLICTSYAFSDTWTPLISSLLSVVFMIVMMHVITPTLGIAGIALTMNLACLLRVAVQMMFLERRLSGLAIREIVRTIAAALTCAVLAFLPVSFLLQGVLQGPVLGVVIAVAFSFALYIALAYVLMHEEMQTMQRGLFRGIRPRLAT